MNTIYQWLEGKKKPENDALANGTDQEIEILFRSGDIGTIAQHYRNVGYNQALASFSTLLSTMEAEIRERIGEQELLKYNDVNVDTMVNIKNHERSRIHEIINEYFKTQI